MTNILSDIDLIFDIQHPVDIAKGISERLKLRRLEQNMTQEFLARRAGVSLGSLKRFENQHEISLKHLLMLAVALNSTDDFHLLFAKKQYESLDELLHAQEPVERKRGRRHA